MPDPPYHFAFVLEVIVPAELEAALITQCGGAPGSALHAGGGQLEVVEVLLQVKVGVNLKVLFGSS